MLPIIHEFYKSCRVLTVRPCTSFSFIWCRTYKLVLCLCTPGLYIMDRKITLFWVKRTFNFCRWIEICQHKILSSCNYRSESRHNKGQIHVMSWRQFKSIKFRQSNHTSYTENFSASIEQWAGILILAKMSSTCQTHGQKSAQIFLIKKIRSLKIAPNH